MFDDRKKPKKKPEGQSLSQAFGSGGGNSKGDNSKNKDIDLGKENTSANLRKLADATKKESLTHPYLTPKKPTRKP